MAIRKNGRESIGWTDEGFDYQTARIPIGKCNAAEKREIQERVGEVAEIVRRLGVDMAIDGNSLTIVYSQELAKEKAGRFAGRPKAKRLTVGEVKDALASTRNQDEAALALGISKRTLARRLKELKEKEDSLGDDDYIE